MNGRARQTFARLWRALNAELLPARPARPLGPLARLWRALNTPLVRRDDPRRGRRGVALIFVVVSLALLSAMSVDYIYRSQIDKVSADNFEAELRAELLARSALNLAQIMLKVQERVIDRNRAMIAQFLQKDLQISDILPTLLEVFFGNASLLSGFGINTADARGLDIPETYGVPQIEAVDSDDGKINVNCAHVRTETDPQVQLVAGQLYALFANPRYKEMMENLDEIGDPDKPKALAAGIIDYVDTDTALFNGGGAAEDYRYQAQADPYLEKNHVIDSVDELRLVRGLGDDEVFEAFAPSLTVYGACTPNLCAVPPGNWILAAAVILQSAKDPASPLLLDPLVLMQASTSALQTLQMFGCTDLNLFAQGAANPLPLLTGGALTALPGTTGAAAGQGAAVQGIELDPAKLAKAGYIGARRFYRLVVTGRSGYSGRDKVGNPIWRVRKTITAVWDQQAFSTSTGRRGMYVYWKQE